MAQSGRRLLVSLLLAVLLLVTSCGQQTASRWDQAQQDTESGGQTTEVTATEPLAGGTFNQFFPETSEGFERVYTQEKAGFAEAKLKQNGQDVAMLAISDTASNPTAAEKYQESDRTIAGYPAVSVGTTATSILVSDRFQVKVLSRSPEFAESDREAWLQRFDLEGLSRLVEDPLTSSVLQPALN